MPPFREELRKWVEDRRAAERLEHALVRGRPPPPEEALRRGLRFVAFRRRVLPAPAPQPRDAEQDAAGLARWDRLRRRMAAR
jgi:hypothetical protein